MEVTLQEKQKLLREQILQSGVNPEGFMEFMSTFKGQNTDMNLETWTMQQLKQVVREYKVMSQSKINQKQEQVEVEVPTSLDKQMTMSIIKEHSQIKTKKFRYHRDELWDYEIVAEEKCEQLQRKISASKKRLSIQCKKFNVKNVRGYLFGLIGSKNQLWIEIFTNFTSNSVERKSDDFDWLHDMLLKRFVGVYVPPLERLITFIPQDKTGIQKRINAIMSFMRYLLGCENIINSAFMWSFLNIHQYGQFENWKKQCERYSQQDLSKIRTVNGTFKAQISTRIDKIINYSGEMSTYNCESFVSLETNLTKVLSDLQTLNKHLKYVGSDIQKISKNYERFQKKANPKQNNQLFLIYTYLNDLVRTFTEQTTSQINVFKDVLEGFIKTNQQQWTQLNSYNRKLKNQLDSYLNEKLALQKKRQKYFENPANLQGSQSQIAKNQNIRKSDLGKQEIYSMIFPKQNQKEQQKRAFQAFLNSQYQQSLMIFLRNQENKTIHYFHVYEKYVKKHNEQLTNFIQSFKTLVPSTS